MGRAAKLRCSPLKTLRSLSVISLRKSNGAKAHSLRECYIHRFIPILSPECYFRKNGHASFHERSSAMRAWRRAVARHSHQIDNATMKLKVTLGKTRCIKHPNPIYLDDEAGQGHATIEVGVMQRIGEALVSI